MKTLFALGMPGGAELMVLVSIVLLPWVVLSLIVAGFVGKHKKPGFWGTFFISFFFSPIIGLLVAGFSDRREKA